MSSPTRRVAAWAAASVLVVLFVAALGALAIAPAAQNAELARAGQSGAAAAAFWALATVTVLGAAAVAFFRNIVYSALGLLTALLGAAALYALLSADFLAVAQLLVYVGGVMVLILFAVMLTNRITDVNVSNASVGLFGGVLLLVALAPVLVAVAVLTPWQAQAPGELVRTTASIGDQLLSRWLLPFEIGSLVLLSTLIGAVVVARKELKAD